MLVGGAGTLQSHSCAHQLVVVLLMLMKQRESASLMLLTFQLGVVYLRD